MACDHGGSILSLRMAWTSKRQMPPLWARDTEGMMEWCLAVLVAILCLPGNCYDEVSLGGERYCFETEEQCESAYVSNSGQPDRLVTHCRKIRGGDDG